MVGCSSPGTESTPEPTVEPTAAVAPTLSPGAIIVGDLVARADAAWGSVTSMRTSFWVGEPGDAGTPPAAGSYTTEVTLLPGSRHVIQTVDGQIVDEQIALNGRVYMKGSIVVAAIAPMIGTDSWVEVDPAAATSNSPVAMQIAYLTSPASSPFSTVSPETMALEAVPAGEVSIGDRTCQTYTFGNASGNAVQYELAIDANDLPCRLLQRSGDVANITVYEFNIPGITITAPTIATPEPAP
jgi:hypothetical protein